LIESLQDGTVSVAFDYSVLWTNAHGSITLHSDESRGEYAIEAGIHAEGIHVDLDVYLNRDVAAARLRQLDNNYYGIVFDTFGDDFRSFANVLGLSRSETDEVVSVVEMLADLLRNSGDIDSFTADYGKLLGDFVKSLDATSERVEITSGGDNVRAQRIDFVATDNDFSRLLEELLDVLENDENFKALFESSAILESGLFPASYDSFIRDIRREVQSFTGSMSGEIVASFFIGGSNRLLRIEIDTDLTFQGNNDPFDMSIDFGASANDLWALEVNTGTGRDRSTVNFEWDMRETSHGGEVIFKIITNDRWSDNDMSALVLSWTDGGSFTLSIEDSWISETILSGGYTRNNDGFRLMINDLLTDSFLDGSLSLTISTSSRSGRIEDVDFINIANWGETLLEGIENILGFGDFMGMPDPFAPHPPPAPGTADPSIINSELVGAWEFSGGMVTYFFWASSLVVFDADGFVIADDEFGIWAVEGNELTVIEELGQGRVRHYFFEIIDGTLYITDSDDDTGIFERLW
jgi:hypothetical protein